jgi:hypothetical protein
VENRLIYITRQTFRAGRQAPGSSRQAVDPKGRGELKGTSVTDPPSVRAGRDGFIVPVVNYLVRASVLIGYDYTQHSFSNFWMKIEGANG